MRKILSSEKIHTGAKSAINEWVAAGMGQNPVVTKARGILKEII